MILFCPRKPSWFVLILNNHVNPYIDRKSRVAIRNRRKFCNRYLRICVLLVFLKDYILYFFFLFPLVGDSIVCVTSWYPQFFTNAFSRMILYDFISHGSLHWLPTTNHNIIIDNISYVPRLYRYVMYRIHLFIIYEMELKA